MGRRTILIVEHGDAIRRRVDEILPEGCDVRRADSVSLAVLTIASDAPDLVVADSAFATGNGGTGREASVLDIARDAAFPPKVIVMAENEDRRAATEAIGMGAFDYCVRSIDAGEFSVLLRRALRIRELEKGAGDAPGEPAGVERLGSLMGSCDLMRGVFSEARRVAFSDVCVLLVGECGTGKKLLGGAIHELGPRRGAEFVTSRSALSRPEQCEEELFGAGARRSDSSGSLDSGLLARADGGTLLLDGVCGFPLGVQARLAEFLKNRETARAEGSEGFRPDVRVIATTERSPELGSGSGALWEDLYYRLGVVTVELPPLRDRGEDIPALARAFLDRFAREDRRGISGFSRTAVEAMMRHSWPGNIAELETRVRRGVVMSRGRLLSAGDLGLNGDDSPEGLTLGQAKSDLERSMVTGALRRAVGNVSRAARSIGVSRPTMYDLIHKYKLDVSSFKEVGTT